jgi:hypothetical protein
VTQQSIPAPSASLRDGLASGGISSLEATTSYLERINRWFDPSRATAVSCSIGTLYPLPPGRESPLPAEDRFPRLGCTQCTVAAKPASFAWG